jgi:hypothetical protein
MNKLIQFFIIKLLDAPFINQAFLDEIKPSMNEINLSNRDRLMHSHGHSM